MMEYRRLGRSGLNISPLVLGTMNFGGPTGREESFKIIERALDAGVNLFDCADVYANGESERILGEALARSGKRKDVFVTSKVFMKSGPGPNDAGNSKHHIIESCENSLKRLKTDYIDIYFLHRTDFNVPQEESLGALDLLVRHGKVRYIASSTHPAWRVVEALMISDRYHYPKFICEQSPYNLLDRRIENEIVPMCRAYDLGIITWSPLAQGVLACRYKDPSVLPEGSRGTQKPIYAERITPQGIQVGFELAKKAEEKEKSPWLNSLSPGYSISRGLPVPLSVREISNSSKICCLRQASGLILLISHFAMNWCLRGRMCQTTSTPPGG